MKDFFNDQSVNLSSSKNCQMTTRKLKIAYLTTTYPSVSHTFIRRELRELERRGHTILRLAIRRSSEPLVNTIDQEEANDELGIRQIELDVYADPTGGKYAKPLGPKLVADADLPEVPHHDPDGTLLKPGLKILHAPDVDYLTTA